MYISNIVNHKIMKLENIIYNVCMMAGRPPTREAPLFGQKLALFRKRKGLTQTELAKELHTTQKMVDYYERRAINPSIEFVRSVAETLGISVDEILGHTPKLTRNRPGPPSKLAHRLEQLQHLPHKDQEFVIQFLDTILEKAVRA